MMKVAIVVISLLLIQGIHGDQCAQRSVCPLNFIYHPGFDSCYNFVISEKVTWFEALSVCTAMDANLAAIETQEELDFLRMEIKGRGLVGNGAESGNSFYLGGERFNGAWQWIGGPVWMTKPMSFAPWRPGRPGELDTKRCAVLYGGDDFRFDNWTCNLNLHYICEIKMK